jgi:hypothetical protein
MREASKRLKGQHTALKPVKSLSVCHFKGGSSLLPAPLIKAFSSCENTVILASTPPSVKQRSPSLRFFQALTSYKSVSFYMSVDCCGPLLQTTTRTGAQKGAPAEGHAEERSVPEGSRQ